MKLTGTFLGLVISFAAANGFAIAGRASFNPSGLSLGGLLAFPRIPGVSVPGSSPFGSQRTSPSSTENSSSNSASTESSSSTSANDSQSTKKTSQLNSPNLLDLLNVPMSLIPGLSSNGIPSIPQIPGLSSLVGNARLPGVDQALDEARNHVTQALSLGGSFQVGLDQAIQDALASTNPNAALQTLVQTILNSYVNVAANCPLIVVGARVLQEGLRLAAEVARSAENVIFGTTVSSTTASTTTSSTTAASTTTSSTTAASTSTGG